MAYYVREFLIELYKECLILANIEYFDVEFIIPNAETFNDKDNVCFLAAGMEKLLLPFWADIVCMYHRLVDQSSHEFMIQYEVVARNNIVLFHLSNSKEHSVD